MRARSAAFLVLACLSPAVDAADWLTVTSDHVRRVELDRASILPSEAGTKVAWGRIVLSTEQARIYGYRSVEALNRYDCRSHSFLIVKRVYLDDKDKSLREERVDSGTPIPVKAGTVDDRFFSEVCRPASLADLQKTAKKAAERIQEAQEEKPRARRADIQLAREETPAETSGAKEANKELPAEMPKIERRKPRLTLEDSNKDKPAAADKGTKENAKESTPERTKERAKEADEEKPAVHEAPVRTATPAPRKAPAPTPVYMPVRTPARPALPAAAHSSSSAPHEIIHWDYDGDGPGGPANWASLEPGNATCGKGTRQSPIDIRDGIRVDQEPIQFDYHPSFFRIVDNGHTVQVTWGAGSRITVMGRSYELVQFHFHHPAEERVDGHGFDMVAHLVHKDPEGRLAVVAVLMQVGSANPMIQTLWNNLPLEQNDEFVPRESARIDDLLPQDRRYFSYIGSLTTPPCTEGVLWLVLKQPMQISAEQLDIFARFYPNNARPIQATAGRIIKESR